MLTLTLSPNPRPPRAYEFVGFDTEGDGSADGFRLAAAYDDSGAHVFHDRGQIAQYLFRSSNRGKRIVACNLEYDWAVAFQPFDDHHGVLFTGDRWLTAVYRDGSKHSWVAWDLQRIAPLSVEEMGDLIGLPKYPKPPALLKGVSPQVAEWSCPLHNRLWCIECYCVRDAEITYRFAVFFQAVLNGLGGQMKPTAASCAMDLFRRRYLGEEIAATLPANNDRARAAYFGGRVETFRVGTASDVNYYDFNSLYAATYRSIEVGDPSTYHRIANPRDPMRYLDRFGQFWGTIHVPSAYLGALPVHISSRLVFPTDTIAGSWTLSEVRHALERGCSIKSCDSILYADRTVKLFRRYVDDLSALRQRWQAEGRPDEFVVKQMLVGLYGKFGQRTDGGLRSLIIPPRGSRLADFEDCEPVEVQGWEGFLREELRDVQSPHVHVLWAAEIAAAARARLLDILSTVEGRLFYSDTDSIHTDAKLPTSNALGALRLKETFEQVTYYAPKEYCGVTREGVSKYKCKGVPDQLKEAYLKGEAVEFQQPTHTLTALATRSRIAEWRTVFRQKRAQPPTRYHKPLKNYARQLVDTRPYAFDEAVAALSDS